MAQEQDAPKLALWLDNVYFASKEPIRRGALTTSPAGLYAEGLFADNQRRREGYENSLSGYLAEPMFAALLTFLSPGGYMVVPAGKERDENNGCDVVVIKENHVIGGFNVKSGRSAYEKRSPSRIKEFPVMSILMEHLGAKELVASLQAGQLPDVEALMSQRLYGPEGSQMREQLRDQIIRHSGSIPQGPFREYLGEVALRVVSLQRRLQSA